MSKEPSTQFIHGLITISAVSLLFLGAIIFVVQIIELGNTDSNATEQVDNTDEGVNTNSRRVQNDPFITVVPDEQRSTESKTEVFVSSLDPRLGYDTSNVYVILFGDFLDTTTADYLTWLQQVQADYEDTVSITWKPTIDTNDESTSRLAIIAACANEQHKFWEVAEAFINREADDEDALYALADSVGADELTLRDCVATSGYEGVMTQSYSYASSLGASNGHTLYVNDKKYTEPLTQNELRQSIDEVLATFE